MHADRHNYDSSNLRKIESSSSNGETAVSALAAMYMFLSRDVMVLVRLANLANRGLPGIADQSESSETDCSSRA